jgi:hypothetical protein
MSAMKKYLQHVLVAFSVPLLALFAMSLWSLSVYGDCFKVFLRLNGTVVAPDNGSLDVGELYYNEKGIAVFYLENLTSGPVYLTGYTRGCSCNHP